MPRRIEFYFDFVSPYGWFAAEQIGDLGRRFDHEVVWQPILLGITVLRAMGLPPLMSTPLKRDYVAVDVPRCARYHGLRFNPPRDVRLSPLAAARAVTWARSAAPDRCEALTLALYRRYWTEGIDISAPDAVADVAAGHGFVRAAVLNALADPKIKEGLARSVEQAIARGIFGSPFFIVDGEPFWGADRLPMIRDWLVRGLW
jgi:2-hydroxychromene-2-carboxylate isomerase